MNSLLPYFVARSALWSVTTADRIRLGAAYRTEKEIVSQARSEAESLRKSQELTGKEELLKRREKLEHEKRREP